MKYRIANMTCGGCVRGVTQAILNVDPAAKLATDLASRRIEIVSTTSSEKFTQALENAGYEASPDLSE